MSKHYINEIGTDFLLDCGISLADIAVQYVLYKTPAAVVGTWNASLYSSYSLQAKATGTYFLKHTFASGELNVSGEWEFQALVANSTGTWYGENVKETIYGTFE